MTETTDGPITQGVHHVGLTVPNLAQTRAFFTDVLGYRQVGAVDDYPAAFLSDGSTLITLWQAKSPSTAIAFDRRQVIGLHHLALSVPDAHALDALYARLLRRDGVRIEFAPEPLRGSSMLHMMCTIPGGIRVEFIADDG